MLARVAVGLLIIVRVEVLVGVAVGVLVGVTVKKNMDFGWDNSPPLADLKGVPRTQYAVWTK